jgi:hypothetical protein
MATDKPDDEQTDEKEIVEAQKLSTRDKKQIEQGLCVNCAVVSILLMIVTMIAIAL